MGLQTLRTLTGKPFGWELRDGGDIRVYTAGGSRVLITGQQIAEVKRQIQARGNALMGACRDLPTPGSLGDFLLDNGLGSPQLLSYLIPILAHDGYCRATRPTRGFLVEYLGDTEASADPEEERKRDAAERDEKFRRALEEAGLIASWPSGEPMSMQERLDNLIEVGGQPLSEQVIADRR